MQRHPLGRLRSALSLQQWTVAACAALLLTSTACGGSAAPAAGTTAPAAGGAAPAAEAKPAVERKSVPFFPHFMMRDMARSEEHTSELQSH